MHDITSEGTRLRVEKKQGGTGMGGGGGRCGRIVLVTIQARRKMKWSQQAVRENPSKPASDEVHNERWDDLLVISGNKMKT